MSVLMLREVTKQYLRQDLPSLKIGDTIEVTIKNISDVEANNGRQTHFKGIVISQRNQNQISYTFTVLKESSKVVIKSIFSYHSPYITSIKIIRKGAIKLRRSKLYYLERKLAYKKANE